MECISRGKEPATTTKAHMILNHLLLTITTIIPFENRSESEFIRRQKERPPLLSMACQISIHDLILPIPTIPTSPIENRYNKNTFLNKKNYQLNSTLKHLTLHIILYQSSQQTPLKIFSIVNRTVNQKNAKML